MNDTQVSIKFTNQVSGQAKLERYAEQLRQINSFLNSIDTGKQKAVENVAKNMDTTSKDTKDMAKNVKAAFDYAKVKIFAQQLEKLVISSTKWIKKSAEQTENLNLLSVAFAQQGKTIEETTNEALKFVNTLSEMYGLDESGLTRTVGLFKQMANSLGITNEAGIKLSQTLTRLSIDAASLFNADEISDAAKVFQSALASQTKPVRGFTGADITQQTLQVTLDMYGIDEAITDLSYAEKRLVIVASLVDQLEEAINDYGKTIESPANQMKIFTEQVHRLGRAIGNVLMPVFYKILPYINAFMMVLVEITSALATFVGDFFGYDFDDYSPFVGINDEVFELEEGLEGANEKAKKLRSGLRGFDKLNVISSDKGSGTSGGKGGVDSKYYDLLNKAVEKYEEKLKNVKMRAVEIRDQIMEWLGFTRVVDEKTGDVSFKFEKITNGSIVALVTGIMVAASGLTKVYSLLKKIGLLDFSNLAILGKIAVPLLVITQALTILKNIPKHFENLKKLIDDPSWKNFKEAVSSGISTTGIVGEIILKIVNVDEVLDSVKEVIDKITDKFNELWQNFYGKFIKPVEDFVNGIANFVYSKAIKPIIDFFAPIVKAVGEIYGLIFKNIGEIVGGVAKAIWEILTKIGEVFAKIVEIFLALGKAFYTYVIKPFVDFVVGFFSTIYNEIIKPIIDLFVGVAKWAYKNIIKPIWDEIVKFKDDVVETFKKIGTIVVDFMSNTFKSVINGVFATIEKNINRFIKALNSAIKIINNIPGVDISKVDLLKIPRLKVGMDFVPNDYYPAFLDYGERVLTRQENQDYSRGIIRGENAITGQPINATFVIQVGDEEIARSVINNLQEMAKSNGEPITISG